MKFFKYEQIKFESDSPGMRYFRTSVRAYATLAWASEGGAKAVISTWRSSWRWENLGSWDCLRSSS